MFVNMLYAGFFIERKNERVFPGPFRRGSFGCYQLPSRTTQFEV